MADPIPNSKRRLLSLAVVAGLVVALLLSFGAGLVVLRGRAGVTERKKKDIESLPLRFKATSIKLGRLVADHLGHHPPQAIEFSFTVWDRGPVTIAKITPACVACLKFYTDLEGKSLSPGSTHRLKAIVTPSGHAGDLVYRALVETSPESPKPLIIQATCQSVLTPGAAPAEVLLEVVPGEKPQAQLHLTSLRSRTIPKLRMKQESSSFPGFTIVQSEVRTYQRRSNPQELFPPMLDEIDLALRATAEYSLGVHRAQWVFKWEGGEPDTVVPVTIRVVHPLVPRVPSLFCGELAPREEWKGVVPLVRHEGSKISLKAVKTSQPFLSASITGSARDQLAVSLVAPDKPGRSQEYVELIFDDQRLPPLRIPVAFVVAR